MRIEKTLKIKAEVIANPNAELSHKSSTKPKTDTILVSWEREFKTPRVDEQNPQKLTLDTYYMEENKGKGFGD